MKDWLREDSLSLSYCLWVGTLVFSCLEIHIQAGLTIYWPGFRPSDTETVPLTFLRLQYARPWDFSALIVPWASSFYLLFCSVTKSSQTHCKPLDYSPPGSAVPVILQARILEWVVISSSTESFQLKDRICVSCLLNWQASFLPLAPPGKPNTTPLLMLSSSVMPHSLQPHGLQHVRISLSFTITCSLLKLISIESVMPSNHLICHPLLFLPSIFPSIKVFSNESALCIRWPKYWSFRFSICPSNEYPGLISFKTNLFDLLAVQGTLKSLLQDHSSKWSILWCSTFFMVHDYWKNHSFNCIDFCQQCDVSAVYYAA